MERHTATGSFNVDLAPQLEQSGVGDPGIARLSIDKRFHGDLEASSKGQMLAFRASVKGSAGYVAIERVAGKLGGRSGSFVLQHNSTMKRGEPVQSITVTPDSGTDELAGLAGTMVIDADKGTHAYRFEYWFEGRE